MATNPQYPRPEPPPPRDVHPKIRVTKTSWFPYPLLIILVAAAILAGFIYWLPRSARQPAAPAGAQVPAQPTGNQIQFTNVRIVPDVHTGTAYLVAQLVNAGQSTINGVAVDATFKNLAGQNLETEHANVMGLVQNGKQAQNGTEQNLTAAPIKPGQTRPVRIDFSHVPQGWNLNAPQLRVVTVTAMGATK